MKSAIERITNAIEGEPTVDFIGLLNGASGVGLFYYYYSWLLNTTYKDKCFHISEKSINIINSGARLTSFCSGIAGFGWFIEFLHTNNLFVDKDIKFLKHFDDYLFRKMVMDFSNGNYDYLHGGLGYCLYFLKRLNNENNLLIENYLKTAIQYLDRSYVHNSNGGIKWESILDYKKGLMGFNISLSHGISSIVVILLKIYKADIESSKCKSLIYGAIEYILTQELSGDDYISVFPSYSIESDLSIKGSRLGWCYGDLGIANALWQAGSVFNQTEWINKAIHVFTHSLNRKELLANYVNDTNLCHGTSGIAHIYYRMYLNTKIIDFKEAANYWFDLTLKMENHPNGLASFQTWDGENSRWFKSTNLLDGISGIGLSLISWLTQTEPLWDECLLLS